jgi:hypothetical protein
MLQLFPELWEHAMPLPVTCLEPERSTMNEISQLATAMVAIVFAAVILVWGELFIEYRAAKNPVMPGLQVATVRTGGTR